jgi:hypothetical protein
MMYHFHNHAMCLFGMALGRQKEHFENTKPKFCVWYIRRKKHGVQKNLPSKRAFDKKT